MLLSKAHQESIYHLFQLLQLRSAQGNINLDQKCKIEQILAYLEAIHSQVRKLSIKRTLVFIDSGAGNCYLSFLSYHYYARLLERPVEIHCIDHNARLMEKNKKLAQEMGMDGMYFHAADIQEFSIEKPVDLSYSLHGCDTATDKAIYLGIRLKARSILAVSCCQHSLKRSFQNRAVRGVTRYKAFKDRLLYMVADTMRAHLLEMEGFRVDIFEFVSSRFTDKNVMIRASRQKKSSNRKCLEEYQSLKQGFRIEPELGLYLSKSS